MSKVTVFDPDGKAHQKEPVDARECVNALGWSMTEPIKQEATDPIDEPKKRGRPSKDE